MDDFLLLSYREHLTLQKYKELLESQHNVKINMPVIGSNESGTDVTFTSISGNVKSINNVKQFLKRKTNDHEEDNASIVVLSSSDSEDEKVENMESNIIHRPKCKKRRKKTSNSNQNITVDLTDISHKPPLKPTSYNRSPEEIVIVDGDNNQSVILIEPTTENPTDDFTISMPTNNNEKYNVIASSEVQHAAEDFIPITSTNKKRTKKSKNIALIEAENTPQDFIPLALRNGNKTSNEIESVENSDIIEISSDEESAPIPQEPRKLRPIVIDGSNVARSHGKPSNTFSCKGIKISVDYFLKRGHTQVTAFVPLFRQHCKRGAVITTDQEILEELEKTQNVVFTPSRKLNGKSYACYDDRFIVELAASNGGVILSNDNYKDLMDESPAFKETIENRLLMFCFVGDTLMIPADPLGSKGPTLQDFLSFPPKDD